jgi:hypothetical protein
MLGGTRRSVHLDQAEAEHRGHRDDGDQPLPPSTAPPQAPQPERRDQHGRPREHARRQQIRKGPQHVDAYTGGCGDENPGPDADRDVSPPPAP